MKDEDLIVEGPIEADFWDGKKKNHVPGLQYVVRLTLVIFVLIYALLAPPSFLIPFQNLLLIISGYIIFQIFLRYKMI